jgi:hypothetical protein
MAPHPALEREQPKNHQRACPELRVRDRRPRQDAKNNVGDQGYCQAIHCSSKILREERSGFRQQAPCFAHACQAAQLWCTGKDSNLRTSLGGTDLQSVGFNHSPTCAKLSGEAAISLRPADRACVRRSLTSNLQNNAAQLINSQNRETKVAHKDHREDHCCVGLYNPEKFRMECVGKTCSPPTESAACRTILASITKICSLELAKGFEPLTL